MAENQRRPRPGEIILRHSDTWEEVEARLDALGETPHRKRHIKKRLEQLKRASERAGRRREDAK